MVVGFIALMITCLIISDFFSTLNTTTSQDD